MAKKRTTIGQMREQVTIMTVSSSPFGDYSIQDTYSQKYPPFRARVRTLESNRSRNGMANSIDGERTHVVIFRNGGQEIDSDDMLLWDGNYYKITGDPEKIGLRIDDPKKRYLRMEVKFDSKVGAFTNPSPESE
jgi:hypothetical protein